MSRIRTSLSTLRTRNEKATGIFLTNGFPDLDSTLPLLHAIEEGGADFIELGMPFSDPLGEGIPIQRANERSLRNGVRMSDAFRVVEQFRSASETPLLLMGYINPVHHYGVRSFCRDASASGADGLILLDLPPQESEMIRSEAEQAGLDLVFLIAPNTPDERIVEIDERATAFVYAVSVAGLTGASLRHIESVEDYLHRARHLVRRNPLLVGFGIKSHEDAVRLSRHTDGFFVGSALISLIEQLWADENVSSDERLARVRGYVSTLKKGPMVDVP